MVRSVIVMLLVSGLVYFKENLANMAGVMLLVHLKGTATSSEPGFTFPLGLCK